MLRGSLEFFVVHVDFGVIASVKGLKRYEFGLLINKVCYAM